MAFLVDDSFSIKLTSELPRTTRQGPTMCPGCGQGTQVCAMCHAGWVEGESVLGCEEGVHLHPVCYRRSSLKQRIQWARERREALERLGRI